MVGGQGLGGMWGDESKGERRVAEFANLGYLHVESGKERERDTL